MLDQHRRRWVVEYVVFAGIHSKKMMFLHVICRRPYGNTEKGIVSIPTNTRCSDNNIIWLKIGTM